MDYIITREYRCLCIRGESEVFYFRNKLFSLSSILVDQNENQISLLKRKSWWNLSFVLITQKAKYLFKNSALDSTLTCISTNEIFHTHGSVDFHSEDGKPVTNITRYKGR